MIGSMVDSLIGSASQKRVHSKSQKRDRSKYQYWEYYRFRNDTNIGYILNLPTPILTNVTITVNSAQDMNDMVNKLIAFSQ